MFRKTFRFVFALMIAFTVIGSAFGSSYAQSALSFEKVDVVMQNGDTAAGRRAATNFTIVCPVREVLDPSNPCSESYNGQFSHADDLVLVCPNVEVLDPSHPCAERKAQIQRATADDYVLVCPVEGKELPPSDPCSQRQISPIKFKIPGDFVMTCPVKEVLNPQHPCAR